MNINKILIQIQREALFSYAVSGMEKKEIVNRKKY